MRVEQLNETLGVEWARMVHSEQQRLAGTSQVEAPADAGSSSSSSGSEEARARQGGATGPATSSSNGSSGTAAEAGTPALATVSLDAVYSPGAPISGSAVGGPGSIPQAAEQHVHEVSSTGAAISLALLLQQRAGAAGGARQQRQ